MIRGVIFDVDGTVVRGQTALPGAAEAVESLLECGIRVVFCSNNPTKGAAAYAEKLSRAGIPLPDAEPSSFVVTAGTATAAYLARHHSDEAAYVFGEDGLRDQLTAADISLSDDAHTADVAVASIDYGFDYDSLQLAIRAVGDDTTFLGTDPDPVIPASDGPAPGSGAIVTALAGVIGREPDAVAGKPSETAADLALSALDVPASETLVVGDRLDTDIALGDRAGTSTALVLSGVTDRTDLAESPYDPDYVLDSLADLPDLSEIDA